jgi:outer membrane protein OmpA-like peptidoglycan-associated protein
VNYLVTKGIDPARMVPKGYGESKLRISDAQIKAMKTKEEQEAAHQTEPPYRIPRVELRLRAQGAN